MTPSLKVSISGQFQKGDTPNIQRFGASGLGYETTGSDFIRLTKTLDTSEYTVPLGDIGTIGFVYVKNNDAAAEVIYGAVTGQLPNKVLPKLQNGGGWNGSAVIIKAVSGTPQVEIVIVEK